MRNFFKLTKAFAAHALIFSLMQSSFIFQAQAASTEVTGQEILGVAKIALQTYGQFLGAKQQMISQQVAAQKNQALMQSLSPSCRKADGTACYTVAGKFFPECPLPASMSTMPQNVCSAATPDPSAVASMITYESIAKGWVNYFDQMQNEASNSATPFGLKCLGDKKKALDSQLIEMQNNLTRLQDQLNKDKETFKANNKKLLDDMKATNDELVGGASTNSLKAKTTDFSKYFSQSCQSIIGDDLKNIAGSSGFVGIMQSLTASNKNAADFNSNRALIESDIRRDIEKSQKLIADGGLDDFLSKAPSETTKYGSVAVAIVKQQSEFKLAKERIAKELSKIGYTLPPMDKNFSVDFNEFLAGSQTFFKKQFVNDCVTGADKSGTAISTDQILSSLKQKSTNSAGTARDKYKAALKTILDSDAFIEDKLAQIKALETNYQDITITYQNAQAQKVTTTPYDLYMKTLAACESRYAQDDTFSATSQGVSQKKKVERGQSLLRELKGLNDNYASQLGSRVLEQSLNCNGEAKKSGAACGGKDSFDTTNVNFCMSQASQCANEALGCYAEAEKHVQTRKTKLEAQAKAFNANTAALVTRSNALYTAQKTAVMEMVKTVQTRFPGTNFAIPADMFITMPEMKKDAFGVDVVNDGNLSFMDELPKKLDLLKKVFKDQQVAVDNEINEYIEKQSQAMEREKGRWNALASECKNMIDTSSREIAKMNNENLKKQSEMDSKVAKFCEKYSGLAENAIGACDDAKKLAEDSDAIISRLTPTTRLITRQFRSACNAFNNEKEVVDDECDGNRSRLEPSQLKKCAAKDREIEQRINSRTADITDSSSKKAKKKRDIAPESLCENDKTSDQDFINNYIAKLPASESKKIDDDGKKKLLEAFTKPSEDIDSVMASLSVSDGDFLYDLKNLLKLGDKKICAAMTKIAKTQVISAEEKTKMDNAQAEVDKLTKIATEGAAKEPKVPLTAEQTASLATNKTTIERLKEGKAAADSSEAKNKLALNEILNNLRDSGDPTLLTARQAQAAEVNRIGEQATNTCDAQAVNTNIAKTFSGSLLPAGFDEKYLGVSK